MKRNYLIVFILSFLLISCSGDKESKGGTSGTTGSDSGAEGQTPTAGTPSHWIFSVPFQRIEKDTFTMGSPPKEADRGFGEDQVPVEISKAFEIMKYEFTQKQWFLLTKKNPSHFKSPGDCDDHDTIDGVDMCPSHPVEEVSWDDIQEYIKTLNAELGLTGCNGTPRDSSGCYRLPTEAEWEHAVRKGSETAYFFGNNTDDLEGYGWYDKNSKGRTHTVGKLSANPNGLHDVYGNVWEWVQDAWQKKLPGGKDPLVNSGSSRIVRGGSWLKSTGYLRSAYRMMEFTPSFRHYSIGFRLVRTL